MAANAEFRFEIDGDRELAATLHGVLAAMGDVRPALEAMVVDWRKTMSAKFAAQGAFETGTDAEGESLPGWRPLSAAYAAWKARRYPGAVVLVCTGALREAAVEPQVELTARSLRLTIDSPYGIYHQSSRPRRRLPRRPFASLTARQKGRWVRALREHIRAAAAGR